MAEVRGAERFTPSPVFIGLVVAVSVLGALLWQGNDLGGFGVFAFVVVGWIVSLSLHEFGHALTAWFGGDRSVAAKGYLTLDVRRYADPGTSLIFPLLILVIGGIGLPGGAVWINVGAIRSKAMRSLVSAAGPIATALCAGICLLPVRAGWLGGADPIFIVALGFLGWIQVIALIFNLIPIPGLDGFGIIEPHLSNEARRAVRPLRQYGMLVLLGLIWFYEPARNAFWDLTDGIAGWFGGSTLDSLRSVGWREFRFWER